MTSGPVDGRTTAHAMKGISLGLSRIARAMGSISQPWDAIHVAGTNGKGSVCTYLSALCKRSGIDNGLFTSPYLVEPRDAIKINGVPVLQHKYLQYRQHILDDEAHRKAQDKKGEQVHLADDGTSALTEFEIGTLVAFSAFDDAQVRTGIVEVGLGGRLDSTNALQRKKVTVITKIGLDHQKMLGDTLPLIAKEKAGIMMADVPCVVDGSNTPEVLRVFEEHAREVGAPLHLTTEHNSLLEELYAADVMPHQAQNMACAIAAFRLAYPQFDTSITNTLPLLKNTTHQGRLSWLNVSRQSPTGAKVPVLIDGAHNPQSAEALATCVEKSLRGQKTPITWIVAISKQDGKDAQGMLRTLTRSSDTVICVSFSRRPTMPWVEPVEPAELADTASKLGVTALSFAETDRAEGSLAVGMEEALKSNSNIVVTGSLYLVGDAYRLYQHL